MNQTVELLISLAIVIGATFTLVASYGLIKLDNPMSRLHAPTKASTLGVGCILAAAMVFDFARGETSVQELLIIAFLFVTAPVSAMFLAKVAIHRRRLSQEPPPPPVDTNWATRAGSGAATRAEAEAGAEAFPLR